MKSAPDYGAVTSFSLESFRRACSARKEMCARSVVSAQRTRDCRPSDLAGGYDSGPAALQVVSRAWLSDQGIAWKLRVPNGRGVRPVLPRRDLKLPFSPGRRLRGSSLMRKKT